MNIFLLILLSMLEVVALFVIARLWVRRQMSIFPRIFWSVVLLIPLFGLMMYGFILSDLEKNPERMDTQADNDAFYGGDGRL